MPQIHESVTELVVNRGVIPGWAVEGVILLRWLRVRGTIEAIAERFRVERQGGHVCVDVMIFLLLAFTRGTSGGLGGFWRAAELHREALGLSAGRKEIPAASSVSRLLSCADAELVREHSSWLLLVASGAEVVLKHPSVMTLDALGDAWRCFDYDPTVTTMTRRPLPDGDDLPTARRRSPARRSNTPGAACGWMGGLGPGTGTCSKTFGMRSAWWWRRARTWATRFRAR